MKASLKHLRISPRKVRLVTNLIKGMSVLEAEKELNFLNKKTAQPILKLLRSAAANAKDKDKVEKENLYISNIIVNAGPTLKRWIPRAMGRADEIMKRTSHITIELTLIKPSLAKEIKKEEIKLETKEENKLIPEEKEMSKIEQVGKVEKEEKMSIRPKPVAPTKPYSTTSQSKKKFFSRQTFGNAKKFFRRKSI